MTPIAITPRMRDIAEMVVIAAIIVGAAVMGWTVQGWRMGDELTKVKSSYKSALENANTARVAAEGRAALAESTERANFDKALSAYKESQAHEKATTDRTIADLRTGINRLRVSTTNSRSRPVSGSTAAAAGSDGPSEETLAPAVAARLAGRYADYNALVDRLTLCQAVIQGRQSTAPPAQ